MTRSVRRCAVLLFALAVVAGCTADHVPTPTGVSPSAGGSHASASFDPMHPSVVKTQVRLTDLGETPNAGEEGVFGVSRDYIVRPDAADVRTTVVIRRSDGQVVLRHKPDTSRFLTDFAWLDGHMLVLADEDNEGQEPAKLAARGWIFDLDTGRVTEAAKVPGAPPLAPYGPQAAVSDGKYYYGASVDGGFSNCIGEIDLVKLTGRVVECGAKGDWMFYATNADHGASWIHFHGSGYNVCREGRRIQNGVLGPVGPPDDCGTFDTTTLGDWQIWGSMPLGQMTSHTTLRATDGRQTVELGTERQFSLVPCNGYVYWDPEDNHKAVARWRPGGHIELIYQATGDVDNTWIVANTCSDGILTIQVDVFQQTQSEFTGHLYALEPAP